MRKGGEDISILSDRNCKIISDPYPRYERQDTGIYTVTRLPVPGEFWINTVYLSFRVPTIAELMSEHLGATSGDPQTAGNHPDAWGVEIKCGFQVVLTSVWSSNKAGWLSSWALIGLSVGLGGLYPDLIIVHGYKYILLKYSVFSL